LRNIQQLFNLAFMSAAHVRALAQSTLSVAVKLCA